MSLSSFPRPANSGARENCIIIMGQLKKKIPSEVGRRVESERFDLKLNICIVVHALLCKVLPDNCTCVNTLNADFVFKKKTNVD